MKKKNVELIPLLEYDYEQFVLDNQEAFRFGAMEEFGLRDNHTEEDGEIISKATIYNSINEGDAYWIVQRHKNVGGMVVRIDGNRGYLDLLFVLPKYHSQGIGYLAWCEVEKMFPEVRIWETCTPYFEKRNIHFYVNRCGFKIIEFFNRFHPDYNDPEYKNSDCYKDDDNDGMFKFEKIISREGA